jgi:heme oxygenase
VERSKRAFRATLDALPLDQADADALVDEARHAFALHEALFVELDAR